MAEEPRVEKDFVDESGKVYIEVVREEVAKAMGDMTERLDSLEGGQSRSDAELAHIKQAMAETDALARAAAVASAVPIKKKEGWEPKPLEAYPKEPVNWVEEYGTTHISVRPDFRDDKITMSGFVIPLRPGHIIPVTKNVADALAEIGAL